LTEYLVSDIIKYMKENVFICGIDIGNILDFPPRTKSCLEQSDYIVVEHVSEFEKIKKITKLKDNVKIIEFNFNMVNPNKVINEIVELANQNKIISLISNSGMPSIYDPGTQIVVALNNAKINFTVVPGPTALITALVRSGFNPLSFSFEGDCGVGQDRNNKFIKIKNQLLENKTLIFYEVVPTAMPYTIETLLDVFGENTEICVCINLTKRNETVFLGPIANAIDWSKRFIDKLDHRNHDIDITYVCNIIV
jgi:16S rRNA (cytidine1402-2'-O)-methyltransferase